VGLQGQAKGENVNNIAFHVYPFPKITNEKSTSNEMDD
jgi:hypothetical protein